MLSRAQIKYIQSLQANKSRREDGVYLAEGEKIADELLQTNTNGATFYALPAWIASHQQLLDRQKATYHSVTDDELKKISTLTTPNEVLAVVPIPNKAIPLKLTKGWYVALDNLQDPGNLGTIIRTADWFGLKGVICSDNTVDAYNPKVVQATMGSILHLPVWYGDLATIFNNNPEIPVLAATLDGANVYKTQLPDNGILVIGNEGKGVSSALQDMATIKVSIPKFGHTESLNAAMAAGILMGLMRTKN